MPNTCNQYFYQQFSIWRRRRRATLLLPHERSIFERNDASCQTSLSLTTKWRIARRICVIPVNREIGLEVSIEAAPPKENFL
jgi:hypothetical protein